MPKNDPRNSEKRLLNRSKHNQNTNKQSKAMERVVLSTENAKALAAAPAAHGPNGGTAAENKNKISGFLQGNTPKSAAQKDVIAWWDALSSGAREGTVRGFGRDPKTIAFYMKRARSLGYL